MFPIDKSGAVPGVIDAHVVVHAACNESVIISTIRKRRI